MRNTILLTWSSLICESSCAKELAATRGPLTPSSRLLPSSTPLVRICACNSSWASLRAEIDAANLSKTRDAGLCLFFIAKKKNTRRRTGKMKVPETFLETWNIILMKVISAKTHIYSASSTTSVLSSTPRVSDREAAAALP